jgi:hypothetical protein
MFFDRLYLIVFFQRGGKKIKAHPTKASEMNLPAPGIVNPARTRIKDIDDRTQPMKTNMRFTTT